MLLRQRVRLGKHDVTDSDSLESEGENLQPMTSFLSKKGPAFKEKNTHWTKATLCAQIPLYLPFFNQVHLELYQRICSVGTFLVLILYPPLI
ncbi:hypothetical protein S83_048419 [Arachis hypogaea]